jgi:hypothetical protein
MAALCLRRRSARHLDFDFNKQMNRALVYEPVTARFIAQREDGLLLGVVVPNCRTVDVARRPSCNRRHAVIDVL